MPHSSYLDVPTTTNMAQRRSYNPNTKYGRKKMRDQAAYNISQYTPEQKADYNNIAGWFWFILLVIVGIVIAIMVSTGHEKEAAKWLSR
jgi:hypothetical protein